MNGYGLNINSGMTKRDNGQNQVVTRIVILSASLLTFIMFIFLDPEPDWLLSICSAINVGVLLYAIFKLYRQDLLLSPLGAAILGVVNIFYYSWGNLGARIEGNDRYLANYGALDYYPLAALLSTLGLIIFVFLSFKLYNRFPPKYLVRYQDFKWHHWQGLIVTLIAALVLIYLQIPTDGIFAEISRLLTTGYRYILILVIIINVSVLVTSDNILGKISALIAGGIIIVVFLLDRSRTNTFIQIQLALLCYITLKPNRVKAVLLIFLIAFISLFSLGTYLKYKQIGFGPQYILSNLTKVVDINVDTFIRANRESLILDSGYRMAGYELPATILLNIDRGISTANGRVFLGALLQGLPKYIRPEGDFSDRRSIFEHYGYRGYLVDDEIMGLPLASGIADFGIAGGLVIYIAMALVYWALWRFIQISPRLYLAFLMIATTVFAIDLFWVSIMVSIRSLAFSWLVLVLFGTLLMPTIIKNQELKSVETRSQRNSFVKKFFT